MISHLDICKRKIKPVSKTTTFASRLLDTNQEHVEDYISQLMTLERLTMHVLLLRLYPVKHFSHRHIQKILSILIFSIAHSLAHSEPKFSIN